MEESIPAIQKTGPAALSEQPDSVPDAIAQPVVIEPESDLSGIADDFPAETVLPDATDATNERDTELSLPELVPSDPLTVTLPGIVADADSDDMEPDQPAAWSHVSFLRNKSASSFWYRPLMRATLALLSVALVLALAVQIAFHERDRIVALQPDLRPWLLAICEPLNCTLSPLRRIESIVIDSSSFTRIRGDSNRLNFTLKNTATSALAVPAIELTLTDSLDQPVVRRVFLPAELGVKSDTLAAGFEWSASLAVAVKAGGGADRVSGYRLLAFYP